MIYILQELESPYRVKIGYSVDPEKRFATIAGALPQKVVLLRVMEGSIEDERFYHEHFKQHRVEGTREWYYPHVEVLEFIDMPVAC